MIRTLVNLLAGRRKIADRELDNVSQALDQVVGLDKSIKIRIYADKGSGFFHSDEATPSEVADYLSREFREEEGYVNFGRSVVYSGEDIRSYIELYHAKINAVFAGKNNLRDPSRTVRLNFIA